MDKQKRIKTINKRLARYLEVLLGMDDKITVLDNVGFKITATKFDKNEFAINGSFIIRDGSEEISYFKNSDDEKDYIKSLLKEEGVKMKKTIRICGVDISLTVEQLKEAIKEFDEPEFDYPICCKRKDNGEIVLFTGKTEGSALKSNHREFGYFSNDWFSHTNTDVWEEIPYDKERGLYHKQPVFCWDSNGFYGTDFRFYDAINKCSFSYMGNSDGLEYENYSLEIPEHMKEFKETK